MKRFAVVQHSYSEFLGVIEPQLEQRDIGFIYFRPFVGQELPGTGLQFDALFLLSGPMSPAESEAFPWLEDELRVIGSFRQARRPIVGIGLGALVLALYEGGRLMEGSGVQAYWTKAAITEAGKGEPLAEYLDGQEVLVWAPAEAELPPGLEPTLRDSDGRWIAFKSENSLGMLFRPEMKPGLIEDMIMEDGQLLPENVGEILAETREKWPTMQSQTDHVLVALVKSMQLMHEHRKPPVFSLKVTQ